MALAVAITALIVAAVAAAISAWQLREARRANAFPAVVDLFREYRSADMVKARRLLDEELPRLDGKSGIRGLPDDVAQAALKVSHYLDNLGVLVAYELVEPDFAAGFLGDSALRMWGKLSPFIINERALRSPGAHLQYFEHLVATFEEAPPSRARRKLKRSAAALKAEGTTPDLQP
jgi:hypothetical protein